MSEGEGSVTFFIQNQNPNLEREIVVEITTTDGTAIGNLPLPVVARGFGLNMSAVCNPDGVDYIGISETVTFEGGQNVSSVRVNLTDDVVYGGPKQFSLRITSSEFNVNIMNGDVTVHIADDDGNYPALGLRCPLRDCFCCLSEIVIQFNPTSLTVTEGGSVEAVIQKIGTSEVPVSVTLSTATGTADSQ